MCATARPPESPAEQTPEEYRLRAEDLLSLVSHDLRTPMVAIQGFLQLLRRSAETAPLAAKQLEYLGRVEQAVHNLGELMDDVLFLRALDRGEAVAARRPCRVADWLEPVVAGHREAAGVKEVELRVTPDTPWEAPLLVDGSLLGQAFGNLVRNGLRLTPHGGALDLEVQVAPGILHCAVRDHGQAIPPQLLEGVFQRHMPEELAATVGRAFGLGAYVAGAVARLHGGAPLAEPAPGGGSRFGFEIPLEDADGAGRPDA